MGVRYDQLPKKVRNQVDAAIGEAPKRRRRDTTGTGDGQPYPYRCMDCPPDAAPFASFLAWERHSSEVTGHNHGRALLT